MDGASGVTRVYDVTDILPPKGPKPFFLRIV